MRQMRRAWTVLSGAGCKYDVSSMALAGYANAAVSPQEELSQGIWLSDF
ncbi:hypothetical protein [Kolteria novifilia]